MKSSVGRQKRWHRLSVTQDGTCHGPSLQYQPACNAHQSHRSAATQSLPERRKRGRGEKEKARSYQLSAVSKTSKSRKLGEGMAVGPGCVQRTIPTPSVTYRAKSCPRSSPADVGLFNILFPVVRTSRNLSPLLRGLLEPGSQFFLWETQRSQGGCRGRSHGPVTAPGSHSMHF